MIKIKHLFFVSLLLISNVIHSENLVMLYEDYPPFSSGTTQNPKGLYYHLVSAIFNEMDVPFRVEVIPFKRALLTAMANKGIVAGLLKTTDREKKLYYSDSFYVEKVVLYVRKGESFKFNSISNLNGKKIGINRGWTYGTEFEDAKKTEKFYIQEAKNDKENFTKLLNKRTDVYIVNSLSAQHEIEASQLHDKVELIATPVDSGKIFIAASNKSDEYKQIIDKFNLTLTKMYNDGTYLEIITKFIKGELE